MNIFKSAFKISGTLAVVATGNKESHENVGPLTPTTCAAKIPHPTIQGVTDTEEAWLIRLGELGHISMVCLYVADNFIRITDYRRESIDDLEEVSYGAQALC